MISVVCPGKIGREITDRVCLAGARQSIGQDALSRRLAEPAQRVAASDKAQDVAIEQFWCGFGQNDVRAVDRRQFVDLDARRAPPIIRLAIERQDLAAVGARRADRTLQLSEAALHELPAHGAGGCRDLDAGPGFVAVLTVRGEHDRVAKPVSLAEPQAVIEAFDRRALADIDFVILRRRDHLGAAAIPGQGSEGQRRVAVLLVDAKKTGSARPRTACRRLLEHPLACGPGTAARSQPTDPRECRRNTSPMPRGHN
jgi:hypothetical protein